MNPSIFLLALILIPYAYAQDISDLILESDTNEVTIEAGSFENVRLSIISSSPNKVHLNANGFPEDVGKIIFSPDSANAPFNSTMSILTDPDAEGSYVITIDAISNGMIKSIELRVNIISTNENTIIEGIEGEEDLESEASIFTYSIIVEPDVIDVLPKENVTFTIRVEPISGEAEEIQLEANIEDLDIEIVPNSGIPPFTATLNVGIVNATDATIAIPITASTESDSQTAVAIININSVDDIATDVDSIDNTPRDVAIIAALISIPAVAFLLKKTGVIKISTNS